MSTGFVIFKIFILKIQAVLTILSINQYDSKGGGVADVMEKVQWFTFRTQGPDCLGSNSSSVLVAGLSLGKLLNLSVSCFPHQ